MQNRIWPISSYDKSVYWMFVVTQLQTPTINLFITQRQLISVKMLLLTDILLFSDRELFLVKAGPLSKGMVIVSLLSQTITELMVGLFAAFS